MAKEAQFEELLRQLSAVGAVKRELGRRLPPECPSGAAAVLTLLDRNGDIRLSRLAELMAVDISVCSRHVSHVAERGWVERLPDPDDKRSRILRLTAAGHGQVTELARDATALLTDRLGDWSDEDVARLVELMTRLRQSFGDCRRTTTTTAVPAHKARTP
jgi:DNA-binding MarR family transcriptional regulator